MRFSHMQTPCRLRLLHLLLFETYLHLHLQILYLFNLHLFNRKGK